MTIHYQALMKEVVLSNMKLHKLFSSRQKWTNIIKCFVKYQPHVGCSFESMLIDDHQFFVKTLIVSYYYGSL